MQSYYNARHAYLQRNKKMFVEGEKRKMRIRLFVPPEKRRLFDICETQVERWSMQDNHADFARKFCSAGYYARQNPNGIWEHPSFEKTSYYDRISLEHWTRRRGNRRQDTALPSIPQTVYENILLHAKMPLFYQIITDEESVFIANNINFRSGCVIR